MSVGKRIAFNEEDINYLETQVRNSNIEGFGIDEALSQAIQQARNVQHLPDAVIRLLKMIYSNAEYVKIDKAEVNEEIISILKEYLKRIADKI